MKPGFGLYALEILLRTCFGAMLGAAIGAFIGSGMADVLGSLRFKRHAFSGFNTTWSKYVSDFAAITLFGMAAGAILGLAFGISAVREHSAKARAAASADQPTDDTSQNSIR